MLGWWQLMGGASPAEGAVTDMLLSIAGHGGLTGLLTCLSHGPADGWSGLAEALAGASGVELRLAAEVRSIADADGRVTCTLASGETVTARAAIVAVPINCLPAIAFDPPLPPRTAEAAGANAGTAVKVVLLARGVQPHGLAVGHAPHLPLHWWYVDDEVDGLVRITGFGWRVDGFDPSDPAHVARALAGYLPEAELVEHATHDWVADPHSRGTWLTAPAGDPGRVSADRFAPHGQIAFAGSDVALEHAGWFEGALVSGAAAARHVVATVPA